MATSPSNTQLSPPRSGRLLGRRLIAGGIDNAMLVVLLGVSAIGTATERWLLGIVALALLDWIGIARFGTTPGKAIFGLRVRSIDGGPVGWVRAGMRVGVKELPSTFQVIAVAVSTADFFDRYPLATQLVGFTSVGLMIYVFGPALVDTNGRGRHDRVANTIVVSLRNVSTNDTVSDGVDRIASQGSMRFKSDADDWLASAELSEEDPIPHTQPTTHISGRPMDSPEQQP